MSLTVSASVSSNIAPIEAGTYPAVCYGLIDLGEQYNKTYDKWSPKILLMWELPGEKIDLGGDEPVSRTISRSYTCSLNEKSALRRDLAAWRGRDFTDDELRAFDLRNIVGVPCLLNIIHREYDGRTYAEVSAIMKMPKGMTVPPRTLEKLIFDLDTDELSKLDLMPVWVGDRIKKSRTYQARTGVKTDVLHIDDLEQQAARAELFDKAESGNIDDEDIPF